MKILFLFCAFVLSTVAGFAQATFTGIGIFKIGTDTALLYKYAQENNITVKHTGSSIDLKREKKIGGKSLMRLYNDKKSNYEIYELDECPDVTEYYLSSYEVGGGKLEKCNAVIL